MYSMFFDQWHSVMHGQWEIRWLAGSRSTPHPTPRCPPTPRSSGGEARPGTSLLAPVAAGSAGPSAASGPDAQSLSSSPTTLLCISNEDTCHWIRAQIIQDDLISTFSVNDICKDPCSGKVTLTGVQGCDPAVPFWGGCFSFNPLFTWKRMQEKAGDSRMGYLARLWLKPIEVQFVLGDRTRGTIWPRVSCDRPVRTPAKGSGGPRTRQCQKAQRTAMVQGIFF